MLTDFNNIRKYCNDIFLSYNIQFVCEYYRIEKQDFTMQTSDASQINVKSAMCQFVPNFLSYVSAKYNLNWFTVGEVIKKIKG